MAVAIEGAVIPLLMGEDVVQYGVFVTKSNAGYQAQVCWMDLLPQPSIAILQVETTVEETTGGVAEGAGKAIKEIPEETGTLL